MLKAAGVMGKFDKRCFADAIVCLFRQSTIGLDQSKGDYVAPRNNRLLPRASASRRF